MDLQHFGENHSDCDMTKAKLSRSELFGLADGNLPVQKQRKNQNVICNLLVSALMATTLASTSVHSQIARANSENQAFTGAQNAVERRVVSIAAGEGILAALLRIGSDRVDAQNAANALARTIDIRDIRRGDQITVFLREDGSAKRLLGFNLASGAERSITVTRTIDGSYRSRELATNMQRRTLRVAGVIGEAGLVASVRELGAPERAAESIADAFAYDVDFEREIGPGSSFELMYDRVSDARGAVVREGEPIFARITTLSGRSIQLYRFQSPGANQAEWYNAQGQPARKFLMRTPINGARLKSNFGMRRHPISGYSRMHAGVDFGAPIGTPIYAAGDGVVGRVGIMGGYGNVVDIEHGSGWSTRYGHISRFAAGLSAGDRVRQGQVIAYVGNTGRSTGPHLHFEVRKDGNPLNPMSAAIPQGRPLSPEIIARFNTQVARVDVARREAMAGVNVAQNSGPTRAAN
jgi:murein DD-endopeptidase MepM/ murein hydrolase activator NlpD